MRGGTHMPIIDLHCDTMMKLMGNIGKGIISAFLTIEEGAALKGKIQQLKNLTDDMIKILGQKGGIIGIDFEKHFLGHNELSRISDMIAT